MKNKLSWLMVTVLVVVAAQAACMAQAQVQNTSTAVDTTPAAPAGGSEPQFGARDPRYRIAPSDSFDLTFPLAPEYNQLAVTVQPDGFVTLYAIGDVKVQGLTVPELTETLKRSYGKILHDPLVSLVLKDFNKPYFIADGQVGHPGKYDLRADTTLTQAIAIAGGLTEDAKHSQVRLIRRVGDKYLSSEVFDVKKMESSKGDLHEDPYLHPGDMVFVPKSTMGKVKTYLPGTNVGGYAPIP